MPDIHPRYQIENLPITEKTLQGANINDAGILARMMSVQDDHIERCLNKLAEDLAQVVAEQNKLIVKFIEEQTLINIKFDARLAGHDKAMRGYAKRLSSLEKRTSELEDRIKELMS